MGPRYGPWTLTFRCNTDIGPLPLFHLTSSGQLNLQINFMRSKDIPPMVVRDVVLKLESNFIRDYDEVEYPSDVFVPIDELFHTENQLEKFLKTMEGATYRLPIIVSNLNLFFQIRFKHFIGLFPSFM